MGSPLDALIAHDFQATYDDLAAHVSWISVLDGCPNVYDGKLLAHRRLMWVVHIGAEP